jgi:hypothetical protein
MKTQLRALISVVMLLGSLRAIAQQKPSAPKTIPGTMEIPRAYFNSSWMTSNGFLLVFSGR